MRVYASVCGGGGVCAFDVRRIQVVYVSWALSGNATWLGAALTRLSSSQAYYDATATRATTMGATLTLATHLRWAISLAFNLSA